MQTIKFNQPQTERLDKFLVPHYPDLSRSQIQKMIKSGLILVNNNKVAPHHFLRPNDQITIEPLPKREIIKTRLRPKIIHKTADYLVIEKPAGLIVHPANNVFEATMTDWLKNKYPEIENVGEDKNRPGIVHRLDKNVSGLMLIARNQSTFEHFKKAFQAHEIKKEYTALVYGQITQNEGTIQLTIGRAKKYGHLTAQPQNAAGRPAETEFHVLKRFKNYTLLKLKLKTGRTHQIRVHLKGIGHSIVGDQIYKTRKLKEKIELNRIFLHADYLGFFDPNKNWQEFKSDLPDQLKNVLKEL